MHTFKGIVVPGLYWLGLLATACPVGAATITFQNLNLDPGQTFVEDGMRYTLRGRFGFIVRTVVGGNAVGNPPAGLLGSPNILGLPDFGIFNVTRVDNGDFTFDRYDFSSFAPSQQSDTWQFRGLLNGVQQFTFLDATISGFVTRTTGQHSIIDTLEISVVSGSTAAAMADNFVFMPVPVPEASSLVTIGISSLIGLGYACLHLGRQNRHVV